jgi:hypothetical protein
MRWFKLTVEEFEASMNPDNASFVTMERQDEKDGDGNVHYCLSEEDKKLLNIVYNRDEWASFLH